RNQRRSGIAHQSDGFAAEAPDDLLPVELGRMIVVAAHRHPGPDALEQLAGDSRVLGEDQVGPAERLGRSRAEVAEVSDRGGDQIESGGERISHSRTSIFASNRSQKESSFALHRLCPGRGAMIVLIAASAVFLVADQAAIAAPTNAYKDCLKQSGVKA